MATPIRVVLTGDVDNLGTSGDVVRVRPGYARNYLIPRGLAAPATPEHLARVDQLKKQAAERAAKSRGEAEAIAKKLTGAAVTIARAAGDDGKMFGSVTTRDIEEAFRAKGVEIDRRKIVLPDPIKTLGLHELTLRLVGDITATLKVDVVKEAAERQK